MVHDCDGLTTMAPSTCAASTSRFAFWAIRHATWWKVKPWYSSEGKNPYGSSPDLATRTMMMMMMWWWWW